MARSWQLDVLDRPAPRRSATTPGARRRPWLDTEIDGVEVSWRAFLAVPSLSLAVWRGVDELPQLGGFPDRPFGAARPASGGRCGVACGRRLVALDMLAQDGLRVLASRDPSHVRPNIPII